jgi:hypothetical protein
MVEPAELVEERVSEGELELDCAVEAAAPIRNASVVAQTAIRWAEMEVT